MMEHEYTPKNDHWTNDLLQGSKYVTQLQIVHDVLKQEPMTMWMVEKRTGIRREYICNCASKLHQQRKIQLLYKQRCKVSGHKAGYYTNTALFKSHDNQLCLKLIGSAP